MHGNVVATPPTASEEPARRWIEELPLLSQLTTADDLSADLQKHGLIKQNADSFAKEVCACVSHIALFSNTILAQNVRLSAVLQDNHDTAQDHAASLRQAHDLITQLQAEKSVLNAMAQANNGCVNRRSAQHPDPDTFSGDSVKQGENVRLLRHFLSDMMIKLTVNADWYPSEYSRMAYFISRLRGTAKGQVKGGTHIDGSIKFDDVNAIVTILQAAFGDINEKATSQKELFSILQGNQPLATFLPIWQETSSTSDFCDEALIAFLKRALHPALIDRLSYVTDPQKTIHGFIAQVRRIDNIVRGLNPTYHKAKTTTAVATIPIEPRQAGKSPVSDKSHSQRRKKKKGGLAISTLDEIHSEHLVLPCIVTGDEGNQIKTTAMTDSGATGLAFVDSSFVHNYNLKLTLMESPLSLRVVDGRPSISGDITHTTTFSLNIKGHTVTQKR